MKRALHWAGLALGVMIMIPVMIALFFCHEADEPGGRKGRR